MITEGKCSLCEPPISRVINQIRSQITNPIYYHKLYVDSMTIDTWNEATVRAAFDEGTPENSKPFTVYVASKTEGERAAWMWVKNNKPPFVFNSVLPYYTVSERIGVALQSWCHSSRTYSSAPNKCPEISIPRFS